MYTIRSSVYTTRAPIYTIRVSMNKMQSNVLESINQYSKKFASMNWEKFIHVRDGGNPGSKETTKNAEF